MAGENPQENKDQAPPAPPDQNSAATPAEPAAEGAPADAPKVDMAGRPFDDTAKMMEAALAEERAAAEAARASGGPSTGDAASGSAAAEATTLDLPDFTPSGHDESAGGIELLNDVELNVTVELGRARMLIEDVLRLGEGSVVELDKFAGDPVDVFVNERLVARGEVLVLNDNFCVRVSEIVVGHEMELESVS